MRQLAVTAALVLATLAGLALLWELRGAVLIFFLSLGTSAALRPAIERLHQWGVPKSLALGMTRGLARTFGPHRITVNAVSPGQVHTPMLMTGLSPEVYESMKKQTPLGYVAEPEEMAGPVVFLASDHAKYITGSTINASGGFLMY